jgi:hypothetical protein
MSRSQGAAPSEPASQPIQVGAGGEAVVLEEDPDAGRTDPVSSSNERSSAKVLGTLDGFGEGDGGVGPACRDHADRVFR